MPLPFLTADHASAEARAGHALPFDDRDRWRRPYRPGPWRVGTAALLLLLASYVLVAAVIIAATGEFAGGAACLGGALVVIAVALRLLRTGVWVSAHGLRRVGFLGTRTTRWEKVVAVRTVQQPVRWLALPRTVQGQALILVRRDRAAGALAPLLTTHSADFLGRTEAFDRAADNVEVWAAEFGRG
ncbi:PH domain-containing protein [Streptomyces graminilatus]|uniref:PH domain-containing protein n=1 Tax=Streptomyces graminilatus TaxID=1464070 RepID=UPI0006E46621|nr:PH domain-containing protein [Streptomyces graminilatus]